jgi:hypothetical protein
MTYYGEIFIFKSNVHGKCSMHPKNKSVKIALSHFSAIKFYWCKFSDKAKINFKQICIFLVQSISQPDTNDKYFFIRLLFTKLSEIYYIAV